MANWKASKNGTRAGRRAGFPRFKSGRHDAESFDTVHEFTREQGLVTSEMVPAMVSVDGDDRRGSSRVARHDY